MSKLQFCLISSLLLLGACGNQSGPAKYDVYFGSKCAKLADGSVVTSFVWLKQADAQGQTAKLTASENSCK